MPKTLDETYARILSTMDKEHEEKAHRILQWLCNSMRPIRLNEMAEALAVDLDDGASLKLERLLRDPWEILGICPSLVTTSSAHVEDSETYADKAVELRLAHFSVKEYLVSRKLETSSLSRFHIAETIAHASISKTCLAYLMHFKTPTQWTVARSRNRPLAKYAAEHWPTHYRHVDDESLKAPLDAIAYDFATCKDDCLVNWLRLCDIEPLSASPDLEWPDDDDQVSLDTESAEALGLPITTRQEFVEWLIPYSNPLYFMCLVGADGVVSLLLDRGADVNSQGGFFGNPLQAATANGYERVVDLLLRRGANTNIRGGEFGCALLAASAQGYGALVQLLLKHGADVNCSGHDHGYPLVAALLNNHESTARLLLDSGANPQPAGGDEACRLPIGHMSCGNALIAASYVGHEAMVVHLLQRGVDVNAKGNALVGCALLEASKEGHEPIVRHLLQNGAKADVDNDGYMALDAALRGGHEGIGQLLIEKGAHEKGVIGSRGDALQTAAGFELERTVKLLLRKGVDVDTHHDDTSAALQIAAASPRASAIAQLLLEHGADVNAHYGWLPPPLTSSSGLGDEQLARQLLDAGAEVNGPINKDYGSALQAAAANGHKSTARLLLERGADPVRGGGERSSPAEEARREGFEEIAELIESVSRSR